MLNFLKRIDTGSNVFEHWYRNCVEFSRKEAIVHWDIEREPYRWHWGELLEATSAVMEFLRTAGIRSGDVCAIIIRHNINFYPIYMGVSALGGIPSVLAYPNNRLHPEKFQSGIEGMAKRSGLDWILTEKELIPQVLPLTTREGSTIRGILTPLDVFGGGIRGDVSRFEVDMKGNNDPCLLQHSSGTTGLQKAVVLTNRSILEHVLRYAKEISLQPEDKVVTWLPLYHDMGLIAAFYLPLTLGVTIVQIDPFQWVTSPVTLLQAISQEKGTHCWLPNFAYNLMADRVHEEDLEGLQLDTMRMFINCSEPVRNDSHEKFIARFERYGLKRKSLAACYAMAETTFAATQTPANKEARRINISRESISQGEVRMAGEGEIGRASVSSGFPIMGCKIIITDSDGNRLPEGKVGEIAIQSVSLFEGYRNNLKATSEVLKDGWYFSGDYGFLEQGELFVIGRKKDIIIVAGKNLYPEDVEDAVNQVEGVIPGRVVAFGREDAELGTEEVGVIAETAIEEDGDRKMLRKRIIEAGMGIDVTISRVYLVSPRWLIKSSSGKPSRKDNWDRAINLQCWE